MHSGHIPLTGVASRTRSVVPLVDLEFSLYHGMISTLPILDCGGVPPPSTSYADCLPGAIRAVRGYVPQKTKSAPVRSHRDAIVSNPRCFPSGRPVAAARRPHRIGRSGRCLLQSPPEKLRLRENRSGWNG
jgi:hypothetical protein